MNTIVQPPRPPAAKSRRRRWAGALLLLLGIGGLAWAVRPEPHLSRSRALQSELFSPDAKNLPPDERKAKFAALRAETKHLSADQKWELSAPMREKQKAEMDRYFTLSPQERAKYLDERIDRGEKMRKEWEAKKAKGSTLGGGPTGGPGPGGASGGKTGGPGRTPPTADEIEKRRKMMLDRTTPEERAKADQFHKKLDARRRQRGLPVRRVAGWDRDTFVILYG